MLVIFVISEAQIRRKAVQGQTSKYLMRTYLQNTQSKMDLAGGVTEQ
jgi:hypothetical protein